MRSTYQLAVTTLFACCLTACGGGNGATKSNPPPTQTSSAALSSSSAVLPTSSNSSDSSQTSTSKTSFSSSSSLMIGSSVSSQAVTGAPGRVDAGKDQWVTSGATVTLSASLSGLDSAPYSYQWTQLTGPSVSIANNASAIASFTAPATASAVNALFKVTVTDKNAKSYTDTLAIGVVDAAAVKRYEAEADTDVTRTSVQKASSLNGYSGSGYVTGYNAEASDATVWSINIENAGYYKIDVGYQVDSYKEFVLLIDTTQYTGKMPFVDKSFRSTSVGIQWLGAGAHQFTVKGGWSYYNLDYLQLTPVAAPTPPQVVAAAPTDPQADAATKALYSYLVSNYGKKTLSGQQDAAEMDTIYTRSGKLPAIYAFDLLNYSKVATTATGSAPSNQTENFIAKVKANQQIGSLIWHWHSPTGAKNTANPCPNSAKTEPDNHCWWNSFYTVHTDFNLTSALADTDGADYKALIEDIDLIAAQLKKVQAAGLPLLWRPLHESDGAWFWWGAKGPESFKKLWRIMHDRLTNYHQLHNLIWVLTIGDTNWYPGDDVVDLVGIDAYPTDKHDSLSSLWEMMKERFDGHKMLVLSEFGGVPFINEMQEKGIWWGYFASWNDSDGSNPLGPKKMTTEELNMIYNLPGVISADELSISNP
jgi:mannan endo-1,4-beta-mannosidase